MAQELVPDVNIRPINILFADDGSRHARSAMELILDLPLPNESFVTVIGVLIPRESSNHSVLESVLNQTQQFFTKKNISSETKLILGYPHEIIIDYADKHKPDLIVVGAKGLRATLGILLGGTAQQIVEYACCPVLIVRAPYAGLHRVAVVIDGSRYSDLAVDYLTPEINDEHDTNCKRFPIPFDAKISIIHVLPPLPSQDLIASSWPLGPEMLPYHTPDFVDEKRWKEEYTPRGQSILDKSLKKFYKCGIKPSSELLWGDAATEIINYTNENKVDLIVAGSRGLGQLRGSFGSVSRKLVHYAGCSVLIVKSEFVD